MTTELKVNASVTATGDEAAAKLKSLAGTVADAKIELQRAKAEAKALDTEIKNLNKTTDGAGKTTADYHNRLRELTTQETLAADAARKAQAAFDAHGRGLGTVTQSAGAARASMVNLGQQIGDVSQGLAAGVNPAMIFAQQSGQVAFALSGMGGALKSVGTFLGGPWGIALTSALVLLSPFTAKLFESGEGAKGAATATRTLEDAIKDLDAVTGRNTKTTDESIRVRVAETQGIYDKIIAKRAEIAAEIDLLIQEQKSRKIRAQDTTERGGAVPLGIAAGDSEIASLQAAAAINEVAAAKAKAALTGARYASVLQDVKAATDPAAAAQRTFEAATTAAQKAFAAGAINEVQLNTRLTAATNAKKAALDAVGDAKRAATKEDTAAAAAAKEYAKQLDGIAAAAYRAANALSANNGLAFPGLTTSVRDSDAAAADAQAKDRDQSGLSAMVDAANARLQAGVGVAGEKLGDTAGQSFVETATAAASVIGQIIGGKAGSTIQSAVQLLGGLKVGSGGGIGSAIGGSAGSAFTQAFTATNQATVKKLGDVLGNVFGSNGTKFASMAGSAFAGASQGSFASSIASAIGIKQNATGAAIGGAIGSALTPVLGPLGPILGGLVGGTLGNLFVKVPKGSTTVSSNAGNVTQSSSGDPTVQKATSALGTGIGSAISAIAEQLGGSVGNFAVSIGQSGKYYRVDGSGAGRTNKKQSGVQAFGEDQAAAVQAAIADAIRDGGVAGVSPRVQTALQRYATDVNKAVAEAMKVKGLEDLLANQANPFASAFKDFETQAAARLKVAKDYGFDLVAIEKLNAEQRAAVVQQTLSQATGSVRQLLDDLKFGDRAEGSISDRRTALVAEQNRLAGLVRGGDSSQLSGLSSVVQKLLDLDKEAGGVAGGFAGSRASSIDLLNELVTQTEDRIKAASAAAQSAANGTADKTAAQLAELNATGDDQVALQQSILTELRNLNANFASGGGAAGITRSLDLSSFTRVL